MVVIQVYQLGYMWIMIKKNQLLILVKMKIVMIAVVALLVAITLFRIRRV
jgi:hypothetical protein